MKTETKESWKNEIVNDVRNAMKMYAKKEIEYIVRAVDAHEDLLEATKAALKAIDQIHGADRLGLMLAEAIARAEGRA